MSERGLTARRHPLITSKQRAVSAARRYLTIHRHNVGRAAITARGLNGLGGAAHGQPLDTQGGLPNTHRYALPVLAAHTHTRIEAHIVADH